MWSAISSVTTWLALIAFLAAVVAWIFRERTRREERMIQQAPETERATLIKQSMEKFHIDVAKLKGADQVTLGLAQLRARGHRQTIWAVVLAFVALLAAIVIMAKPSGGSAATSARTNTLSEAQISVLTDELRRLAPARVRVVLIGDDPNAAILSKQLTSLFVQAGWNVFVQEMGQVSVKGPNLPRHPYMTAARIDTVAVHAVYTAFQRSGLEIPVVPSAYRGDDSDPRPNASDPDVVIIARAAP